MRRILLGSTALAAVAAVLAPGTASAEEGLRLTLGGRYLAAFGGLIGEDENLSPTDTRGQLRDYVMKQDVEIHFKGETTFDNGLTVGVRVELEGQTSTDQIDSVYAYFDTKWGELRFGDTLESLASLCYTVPSASSIFGADSPIFNFSNAGVTRLCGHQRHLLRHRQQIHQSGVFQPDIFRIPLRRILHARRYRRHPEYPQPALGLDSEPTSDRTQRTYRFGRHL